MTVRLRVVGSDDSHREVTSLREWLGRESLLRGHIHVELEPIRPGEMGGLENILVVAVGSSGAATVLARSVTVWLQQRRSELRVEITGRDGSHVGIDAKGPVAEGIATLADQLGRMIGAPVCGEENSDVDAGRTPVEGGPDRDEPLLS
ncbi:hypothetical protein [Nocardia salmonicida]|uniref:effector-associated constant component EACC1 n=1 Tax=Nocardia salmonicida TaxID=53431 RepID=UPI00379E4BAA